jgi:TcpE family
MSDTSQPIRSYQRIFHPQRRIYQIDGKRLPVPGGVPLEWLAWAFCALVLILVLCQRSLVFAILLGVVAGAFGGSAHGMLGGLVAFLTGVLLTLLAGVLLGWLDWPLRLLICPGLLATLAGQASPDGRPAHRYLASCIGLRLRAQRRSLERVLPAEDAVREWASRVWVAADEHSPVLQHGRVRGPARLVFGKPVVVIAARRRFIVRPAEGHRVREGERHAEVIELGDGQILEVRP